MRLICLSAPHHAFWEGWDRLAAFLLWNHRNWGEEPEHPAHRWWHVSPACSSVTLAVIRTGGSVGSPKQKTKGNRRWDHLNMSESAAGHFTPGCLGFSQLLCG